MFNSPFFFIYYIMVEFEKQISPVLGDLPLKTITAFHENRLKDAAKALGSAWTKQTPVEEDREGAGEVVNGKK